MVLPAKEPSLKVTGQPTFSCEVEQVALWVREPERAMGDMSSQMMLTGVLRVSESLMPGRGNAMVACGQAGRASDLWQPRESASKTRETESNCQCLTVLTPHRPHQPPLLVRYDCKFETRSLTCLSMTECLIQCSDTNLV